jgi:cobalt-zinc-cadmium efflux system protein
VNASAILIIAAFIAYEAITRLAHPESVDGGIVLVVALAAALLNTFAAVVLYERRVDLNMRAALLHMAGDAAASLGVAAAGLVILVTGEFEWLDPVVSIGISILIAIEAWHLVRAAIDVLLESAPRDIDLLALRAAVTQVDDVVDVHDLHVWSLSSGIRALSAHMVVDGQPSLEQAETVAVQVKEILGARFDIAHATLEIETVTGAAGCVSDVERHVPG